MSRASHFSNSHLCTNILFSHFCNGHCCTNVFEYFLTKPIVKKQKIDRYPATMCEMFYQYYSILSRRQGDRFE